MAISFPDERVSRLSRHQSQRARAGIGNRQGRSDETPAILAFVAQSFPQARLAPLDDPFGFAEVQAFNSYLCSTLHVAHAHACAEIAGPMIRPR